MTHEQYQDDLQRRVAALPFRVAAGDLPFSLAQQAHEGTSFDPERRGRGEQEDYLRDMLDAYERLAPLATTDAKRATLAEELAQYRDGYLKRAREILRARSRTMSPMITGPANFPAERNRKRMETERRRADDLAAWRERALKAIRRKLRPETAAVSSTDADALAKLQRKRDERAKAQETMKQANRIVRSGRDVTARLVELGLSEEQAAEAQRPDFAGRVGFADYVLANNRAEIKRLEKRIAELQAREARAETTGGAEAEPFDGGRVEYDHAGGYLRVVFDAKPDAETRQALKGHGFRWARSEGVWRRKLTPAARHAAAAALGISC